MSSFYIDPGFEQYLTLTLKSLKLTLITITAFKLVTDLVESPYDISNNDVGV